MQQTGIQHSTWMRLMTTGVRKGGGVAAPFYILYCRLLLRTLLTLDFAAAAAAAAAAAQLLCLCWHVLPIPAYTLWYRWILGGRDARGLLLRQRNADSANTCELLSLQVNGAEAKRMRDISDLGNILDHGSFNGRWDCSHRPLRRVGRRTDHCT